MLVVIVLTHNEGSHRTIIILLLRVESKMGNAWEFDKSTNATLYFYGRLLKIKGASGIANKKIKKMNECCHVYLPNFMIGFKPTNKNLAPLLLATFI